MTMKEATDQPENIQNVIRKELLLLLDKVVQERSSQNIFCKVFNLSNGSTPQHTPWTAGPIGAKKLIIIMIMVIHDATQPTMQWA